MSPRRRAGAALSRTSARPGWAALALGLALGCAELPPEAGAPELATHVADWRDQVMYQVIVDRFANGDPNNDWRIAPGDLARYQGGDWLGLEQHLGYLKELGVTTLWISPVVRNVDGDGQGDAYMGYWAQDLWAPNPRFGDLGSLRSLVAAAHAHGILVVVDIAPNHLGAVFFYDINRNGQADVIVNGGGQRISEHEPALDLGGVKTIPWTADGFGTELAPAVFYDAPERFQMRPSGRLGDPSAFHRCGILADFEDQSQYVLGDFPGGFRDLATERPAVREELLDAYVQWVVDTDLDGFRIDAVKHTEVEFWDWFAPALRRRLAALGKTRFLLVGEQFFDDDGQLGVYTAPGRLDAMLDFPLMHLLRNVFIGGGKESSPRSFAGLWHNRPLLHGTEPQPGGSGVAPADSAIGFLDNHDLLRFLHGAGDIAALHTALGVLLTAPGIPCLYYGTEQGFAGGTTPSNREPLWVSGFDRDHPTYRHIARLAEVRGRVSALRRGGTRVVWAAETLTEGEDAGILAYERSGGDAGDSYALVVVNLGQRPATSASAGTWMQLTRAPGERLVDQLGGSSVTLDETARVAFTLPARQVAVFVPASSPEAR